MKLIERIKLKIKAAKYHSAGQRQLSKNDCGIAVIKSICASNNIEVTRRQILKDVPIDEMGTSFDSIKKYLTKKNLNVRYAVIGDFETSNNALCNSMPCVAMVKVQKLQHFIYLLDSTDNYVLVMDPSVGDLQILPWKDLKSRIISSESVANEEILSVQIREYVQQFLSQYNIDDGMSRTRLQYVEHYNKIKYFYWFKDKYDFKSEEKELSFIKDLLIAEERRSVPSKFRAMRVDGDSLSIKTPIVLSIKEKSNSKPKKEKNNGKGQIEKLFSFMLSDRPSKIAFSSLILVGMFVSIISYSAIYANQILIDEVIPQRHTATLYIFAAVLFFFRFSEFILHIAKSFSEVILNQFLDRKLFHTFEKTLLGLDNAAVKRHTRGDLTQRANDVLRIKGIVSKYINNIVISTIVCIFSVLMLFYFSAKIAFLIILIGMFYLFIFHRFSNYIRHLESKRFTEKGVLLSSIIEKIEGHSVIKRSGSESDFLEDDTVKLDRYLEVQKKGQLATYLLAYIPRFIAMVGSVVIIIMAGRMHLLENTLSLGQILTVIMLSELTFTSLRLILSTQFLLQEQIVVIERFFDFCEQPVKETNLMASDNSIHSISFQDFSFTFPNSDFTLSVPKLTLENNQRILVSGSNGSGKTTFLNTIGSNISLDDVKGAVSYISNNGYVIDTADVTRKVYLVRAEDKIFNDTLLFNITLQHHKARKNIYDLAREIGADDFINTKVMPMDTVLHENGDNLSTGQRRKLLVLRALLSDADILIFDEIFRGIDVDSKAKIFNTLNNISNKIMIYTTHEDISSLHITRKLHLENGIIISDKLLDLIPQDSGESSYA